MSAALQYADQGNRSQDVLDDEEWSFRRLGLFIPPDGKPRFGSKVFLILLISVLGAPYGFEFSEIDRYEAVRQQLLSQIIMIIYSVHQRLIRFHMSVDTNQLPTAGLFSSTWLKQNDMLDLVGLMFSQRQPISCKLFIDDWRTCGHQGRQLGQSC